MGNLVDPAPPRLAARFAALLVASGDREAFEGDLAEQFAERVRLDGLASARRWYTAEVLRSAPALVALRLRRAPRALAYPTVVLGAFALAGMMQNILVRFPAYRHLYRSHPFYVPEFFKNMLAVCVCLLVLRMPLRRMLLELRLKAAVFPALAFALIVSAPMLLGIVLTRGFDPPQLLPLLFLSAFGPFTEEVIARGFAVGQLFYRARWPLWAAVLVSALVTGLLHVEKGATPLEMLGLFLLTGTGAAVFSWLMVQYNSLWVPIALHASMNLWWELFRVSRIALGDWYAFSLQSATIVFAIALTLIIKRYDPDMLRRLRQRESPGRESPGPAAYVRRVRFRLAHR